MNTCTYTHPHSQVDAPPLLFMQFIYFPISLLGCFLFYAWPWLVFSQFTSSSNYAKKAGNHSTVNQHESQGEEREGLKCSLLSLQCFFLIEPNPLSVRLFTYFFFTLYSRFSLPYHGMKASHNL